MSERERNHNIYNPVRALRALAQMAMIPVRIVDEAIAEFNDEDYPPVKNVERPVATEDELLA